jgi:hypothetical protein
MKIFKYLLIVAILTVSSVCIAQTERKEIFKSTQVTQALKRSLDTNGRWRVIWLGETATEPETPPVGTMYMYAGADHALYIKDSNGVETQVSAGGGAHNTIGGSDKDVQFNDAGVFGGDSDFQWDKTTNILSIAGSLKIGSTIDVFMDGNAAAENLFIGDVAPGTIGPEVIIIGFGSGTNISATATEILLIGDNVGPDLLFDSRNNVLVGHDIFTGLTLGTVRNIAIGRMPLPNVGNAEDNVLLGDSIFGTDTLTLNNNLALGNSIANNSVTNERNVFLGHLIDDVGTATAFRDSIMMGHDIGAIAGLNDHFLNIGDIIFADLAGGFVAIGGSVAMPTTRELTVNGDLEVTNDLFVTVDVIVTEVINGIRIDGNTTAFSFAELTNDKLLTDMIRMGNGALSNPSLTGIRNLAFGTNSQRDAGTANQNVSVGHNTLILGTVGTQNTAIGDSSLDSLTGASAINNTGIGANSGSDQTTGNNNLFAGQNAGDGFEEGDGNIFLGAETDSPEAQIETFCNIGNSLFADLSADKWRMGGSELPDTLAQLELNDDELCLLLNRVTTTNEGNFDTDGMIWYNSTTNEFRGRLNGGFVTFDTTAD